MQKEKKDRTYFETKVTDLNYQISIVNQKPIKLWSKKWHSKQKDKKRLKSYN